MTTLNAELYDALRAINVPDDKARAAASALDGYDSRFTKIESELAFHRWAFALIIGLQVAILAKLFLTSHGA